MDDPSPDRDPDSDAAARPGRRPDGGTPRGGADPPSLAIPRGQLVRSRVVADIGTTLSAALERGLTGYAVVAPGDALLLDGQEGDGHGGDGVLAFEDGVPTLAYHAGTDAGGPAALSAFGAGPCRVEVYECGADALRAAAVESLRIPPGLPAERLATDPGLAERTRARAPDGRASGRTATDERAGSGGDADDLDAVEAFLDDEDRVAAIRERAREEARRRAAEWGLDDHLE